MDASNLWFFGMHLLTSAFCLMSPIFHLLYSVSRPLAHVFGLPLSIFRLILSSFVCQRPFHLSSSIFSLSYSIGHHSSFVFSRPSLVSHFFSWSFASLVGLSLLNCCIFRL